MRRVRAIFNNTEDLGGAEGRIAYRNLEYSLMTRIPIPFLLRGCVQYNLFKQHNLRLHFKKYALCCELTARSKTLYAVNIKPLNGHCKQSKQSWHCVPSNPFSLTTFIRLRRSSSELITKPHLVTMKIDSPQFHAILTPELHALIDLFNKYNYEIRVAGGAVRDLLAGKIPADIDFATTATPAQMKDMFTKENIRMVNTNGEAHGTITARIHDKENFEVTTLRIDVVTDGRRAEVEFTKDWILDANRRDLTVNSMFLGFDGTVYDYFNGIQDLEDKRVCFVGDAEQRIQEDYLRILRYFRFYGRLAKGPNCHEEATLGAIKTNANGLARVSGERIWVEMKKILTGRMVAHIVEKMIQLGLGPHIGLPNASNFSELCKICELNEGSSPHHMTIISAVLDAEADVYKLHERNKMSNDELSLGLFIVKHREDNMGDNLISYCIDLHTDTAGKETKVINKIVELMKYRGCTKTAEDFPNVELPQLPVTGHDLTQKEVPRGPKFAATLNELRRVWKESRYTLGKDELLQHIPQILEALPQNVKKIKKN